jgi:hypothetical protein
MRRLLDLVPVGSRNDESIPGLALPHHAQWLPSPDPSQARDEELARQRLAELGASNQLDAQVNRQDLRLIKTVMANARRQTLQTNAGLVAAAYLSTMNCAALVQASNMLNVCGWIRSRGPARAAEGVGGAYLIRTRRSLVSDVLPSAVRTRQTVLCPRKAGHHGPMVPKRQLGSRAD